MMSFFTDTPASIQTQNSLNSFFHYNVTLNASQVDLRNIYIKTCKPDVVQSPTQPHTNTDHQQAFVN